MIKRCVRHHSWESPCHAAMRCVGATHVLHSVFADMEDDLTVGTVVKTACYQFAVVPAIRRQLRVDGYDFVFYRFLAAELGSRMELGASRSWVRKWPRARQQVPRCPQRPGSRRALSLRATSACTTDSSGLTDMTLFFLQISGSRIRLARGAECQPQFGTKLAKGRVAGLCVSFVANTVCNMALCCCTAAFTAYIRFRVDSHYFSFWPQKFSPARGSVPTTVRRASGQGRVSVHYVSCAAKEPSRVPTTCWHGVYDRQFRLARRFSKFNSFSAFVPGTVLESHVYGRHDCIDSTRSSQP